MNNLQHLLFSNETEDRDFQQYLRRLLSAWTYQSLKTKDFMWFREATRDIVIEAYRKKYRFSKRDLVHAKNSSIEKYLATIIS